MDTANGSTDPEYLLRIERLSHAIVEEAAREGWLAFDSAKEVGATPLQSAVNELARHLRFVHFRGDGCVEH
ncbi:hypothetical protein [Actinoplanes sp. NPDC049681]|uniref:hypothetical protein n=1 Tax=Actinoplanes sp. NPDC049681 TaxID=3363905 RepID=UPI0037ACD795